MRPIEFRGKSTAAGEWMYGDLVMYGDSAQIWTQTDNGKWNAIVDPETVGQFTGQLDENDVKLFEGDFVKYAERFDIDGVYEVGFTDTSMCFALYNEYTICDYFSDIGSNDLIVVGNIYDNDWEEFR
ncbi:MAG: YopX family protein [Oscillospiraceae bacterium]|jgi:uncharacterized phage protein (TIGR01671 family)|nr:YopX family protein [Oscillospiraceae bacterium]